MSSHWRCRVTADVESTMRNCWHTTDRARMTNPRSNTLVIYWKYTNNTQEIYASYTSNYSNYLSNKLPNDKNPTLIAEFWNSKYQTLADLPISFLNNFNNDMFIEHQINKQHGRAQRATRARARTHEHARVHPRACVRAFVHTRAFSMLRFAIFRFAISYNCAP
jgi:hypothetical protein